MTARLVAEIRGGGGPRLLHARTYRWTGHTSTDPAAWRDPQEVAAWKARCPIGKLRAALATSGMTDLDFDWISSEAAAEMRAAREGANSAAWPGGPVAFEDVQDTGAVAWRG